LVKSLFAYHLNKEMNMKYNTIFIVFSLLLSSFLPIVGQQVPLGSTLDLIIKDDMGNPLEGATVYASEGAVVLRSDGSGKIKTTLKKTSDILVEAKGFKSKVITAEEYSDEMEVSLTKEPLFLGKEDDIPIAFGRIKELELTGAVTTIKSEDLLKYDFSLTLDKALPGLIPGLYSMRKGSIAEMNKGPIVFRGYYDGLGALVLVDGLPRNWETISLAEIDQISFLKDVHSSILYGTEAANGVVLITTKRGEAHKQKIDIYGYFGIETPKALPKYLSSADYLDLYSTALQNDGQAPYDRSMIENYRTGNPYEYPDIDYYSKDYLRSVAPFSNIIAQFSGGNKNATYFTNLGWEYGSDLVKIGKAKNVSNNAFKARGNVDLKVNNWISTAIDAYARFENNGYDPYSRTLTGNYWVQAANLRPNLYSPLIPIDQIKADNPELLAATNIIDGKYLLGGNAQNQTGPIADLYSKGDIEVIQRWYQFNNRIKFDLDWLVKGLSVNTNFNFDFWTNYQQATPNQYAVYEPTWENGQIVSLKKHGEDRRPGTQNVSTGFFERRFGASAQVNYDRIFNDHHVTGSFLGYLTHRQQTAQYQSEKNAHLGLHLAYSYKHKYMIDFNGNMVNSIKLPDNNRLGFSPSLGLGWVLSSEDFLSSADFIDLLKIRLSGGILNTDYGFRDQWYQPGNGGFYWYDDVYTTSGSYNWKDGGSNGSASGVIARYGANSNLSYEKRKDINIGIDGVFFNQMIGMTANIFFQRESNKVTRMYTQYPGFYSDFAPYSNFNENEYRGFEVGLTYNKQFGDFTFNFTGNVLYSSSEIIKVDEIHAYDYLYKKGRSVYYRYGLVAEGFFKDDADIKSSPFQTYGQVRPGDIKYKDQNGDQVINSDDMVEIGNSRSPWMYGLNILLSYKGFNLFVSGWGRSGADMVIPDNGYYRPRSTMKYSEYIVGKHWTPATASTATMPRLTTTDAVNNNQSSTFWQRKDNYFYLEKVQLTYNFPEKIYKPLHMKDLGVFLKATDLATISKNRDIRDLSIGSRPYMRSFNIGVKVAF